MDSSIIDHLDSKKIKKAINNLAYLATLTVFPTIGSTNDYLLQQAKLGELSGSVCFAEQQTQGRGRRGRVWFSPPGANLYCSFLWHFPATQPDLSALSIAVAVMVIHALKKYGVQANLELKWPNDVLFQGRKLSGILLESLPEQNGKIAVVIGIGLNLSLPSKTGGQQWIDLAEITDEPILRNDLAGLLVDELLSKLPLFQERGLHAFIDAWNQHDVMKGKKASIHTASEDLTGIVRGISHRGELLLELLSGEIKTFPCGEVTLRY